MLPILISPPETHPAAALRITKTATGQHPTTAVLHLGYAPTTINTCFPTARGTHLEPVPFLCHHRHGRSVSQTRRWPRLRRGQVGSDGHRFVESPDPSNAHNVAPVLQTTRNGHDPGGTKPREEHRKKCRRTHGRFQNGRRLEAI